MPHATPGEIASVVFAAGKGSRMTGYEGNKTLLPLIPTGASPYEGERPMLLEVLENLPPGPKGVVVHHRAEDVRTVTAGAGLDVAHLFQEVTNGTGGALLAARPSSNPCRRARSSSPWGCSLDPSFHLSRNRGAARLSRPRHSGFFT